MFNRRYVEGPLQVSWLHIWCKRKGEILMRLWKWFWDVNQNISCLALYTNVGTFLCGTHSWTFTALQKLQQVGQIIGNIWFYGGLWACIYYRISSIWALEAMNEFFELCGIEVPQRIGLNDREARLRNTVSTSHHVAFMMRNGVHSMGMWESRGGAHWGQFIFSFFFKQRMFIDSPCWIDMLVVRTKLHTHIYTRLGGEYTHTHNSFAFSTQTQKVWNRI